MNTPQHNATTGGRRDPSALLAGLRLPREEPAPRSTRRAWPWLILAAAVAGAFAGVALIQPPGSAPSPGPAESAREPAESASMTEGQSAAGDRLAGEGQPSAGAPTPAPATPTGSTSVLDATGYVVARRQATVSAKTTGKVREVLVEEGMTVDQGQVIARLDDSVERAELSLAEAQLQAARAATRALEAEVEHAHRMLERSRALAQRDLLSRSELEDRKLTEDTLRARLEQARRDVEVAGRRVAVQRRRLEDLEIVAPFRGVVIEKTAQPGEMVSPISAGGGYTRTGLGTIVDMDSLEVEVDVNEAYISRVKPGQPVRVTLNAYPDRAYPAEVLAIVPAADRSRATVRVRVGFRALDDRVLPDMGVRVAFLNTERHEEKAHETHGS